MEQENTNKPKVVELKCTVKMKPNSKEGKSKDGDAWLHPEVSNPDYERNVTRSINMKYRTNKPERKDVDKGLYIDLEKAKQLHKEHLVKRPVQVKGENGKIFTRMQWVDPRTGQPAGQSVHQEPPGNLKDHVDAHLKKMSREDKYALIDKHDVKWKRHENEQKDHMLAMMALKKHLTENPHLVGGEHLPKGDEKKTPEGTDKVNHFLDGYKKDRKGLYDLMKKLGIADSDPAEDEESKANNTHPIKHMHNMMQLKKYLKENPHAMEGGEDTPAERVQPPKHPEPVTGATPAQKGGNTIQGVLKNMSAKEIYDLMSKQGITDVDPRTVDKFVQDGTAPIKHMHNMMQLKKKIELDPSILNMSTDDLAPPEKERIANNNTANPTTQRAKDMLGAMSKELKERLIGEYKDEPALKSRTRYDDTNIDYMHGVMALRKHFEAHPELMDKHQTELDHEQLLSMKIGNKQMGRILREIFGLKGVGDVTQTESHKEYSFGESSFARVEQREDGMPVLSVVDTGKDGEQWDEHEIELSKVKSFLEGDTSDVKPKEVALHNLPVPEIIKAINEDFSKYDHKIQKAILPELRRAFKDGGSGFMFRNMSDASNFSSTTLKKIMETNNIKVGGTGNFDYRSNTWNKLMYGDEIDNTKTKNATEYFRKYGDKQTNTWLLHESAKRWSPEERADARKDLLHHTLDIEAEADVLEGVEHHPHDLRAAIVNHLHKSLEYVPFDLFSDISASGKKISFKDMEGGGHHNLDYGVALPLQYLHNNTDNVMTAEHPMDVSGNHTWPLAETVAHEFAHAIDAHLSGGDRYCNWDTIDGKKYAGRYVNGIRDSYEQAMKKSNPKKKVGFYGDLGSGGFMYHLDEWMHSYEGRVYGRVEELRDRLAPQPDRSAIDKDYDTNVSNRGVEHWSEGVSKYANAVLMYQRHREGQKDTPYDFDTWARKCHDEATKNNYGTDSQHDRGEVLYSARQLQQKDPATFYGFAWHKLQTSHPIICKTIKHILDRSDFVGEKGEGRIDSVNAGNNVRKSDVELLINLD